MRRILHLVDGQAGFQARWTVGALTGAAMAALGTDYISNVLTIGSNRYPASENTEPLVCSGRTRNVFSAACWLNWRQEPEILHTWGARALHAAALVRGGQFIHSPSPKLDHSELRRMMRVARRGNGHFIFYSHAQRNRAVCGGLPADLCRVIRPGLKAVATERDWRLRVQLGFEAEDFVVLAPGESNDQAEHALAVWTTVILHELDPRWRLLVWGRGDRAGHVQRLAQRMGFPRLVRAAADLEPGRLLAVADAALLTGRAEAENLPLAMCMAAGVPMVSTPREGLVDGRNAIVVGDRGPRRLAQALMTLRADEQMRKAISGAGRADAEKRYSMEGFVREYGEVYAEFDECPHPNPPPEYQGRQ